MNSIEIFAGGGGLALGVKEAGFSHSGLIEWDKNSVKTLHHNCKNFGFGAKQQRIHNNDICDISFLEFRDKIDLLSGGPPCQPFSIGGKHKAYNDDRDMFPEATRTLREIWPKAFIFENVRGLLRKTFSEYFGYIILQLTYPEIQKKPRQEWQRHLAKLEKYHTSNNVVYRLLNAADYGVPQKRERVFIIGFRNDIDGKWSFPEQTHSEAALHYSKFISGDYWKRHSIKYTVEKEAMDISLWNIVLDGFGNHEPGSGRYNQQRSAWDIIHPGRQWAEKLQEGKAKDDIVRFIDDFFNAQPLP